MKANTQSLSTVAVQPTARPNGGRRNAYSIEAVDIWDIREVGS